MIFCAWDAEKNAPTGWSILSEQMKVWSTLRTQPHTSHSRDKHQNAILTFIVNGVSHIIIVISNYHYHLLIYSLVVFTIKLMYSQQLVFTNFTILLGTFISKHLVKPPPAGPSTHHYSHGRHPQSPNDLALQVSSLGFHKWGYPNSGWFRRENPIKMDDLGVPPFMEPLYIVFY